MKKYLVVGNPIEHSLSPKLQNYWLNLNNIEAIYGKLLVYEDDLKELAQQDRYKKRIKDHLDQLKISIENRKRELNQTYLTEELKKMETKAELMESLVNS